MVEKVSAFFVGNVVGLTILVGGVLLTAPNKLKETEAIQKQASARQAQSAEIEKANNAKNLTPHVVAARAIAVGEKITAAAVKLEQLPTVQDANTLGENTFDDMGSVLGKTATAKIQAGTALTNKVLKD